MADEGNVAAVGSTQHRFDLADNALLGVDGPFPAANAFVRIGEELSATASNSGGGRKPVADRSFSCMRSFTSTARPRCLPRISAVSIALRSADETTRRIDPTHG
ncbi:hypothetical protein X753_10730 [Mesorhizobium sp. LNJC399B00]|nr:hypothetical protein X753_10730 [Mesorhizobium sp. LNJC399B00]